MPVQSSSDSSMQKPMKILAAIAVTGAAALVLGFALLIFAQFHERAYVFLFLGAGGFMGGFAGIIVKGQKVRVVVDYGLIAMGFVAMVVGLNYVSGTYGTEPSLIRGLPVIAAGTLAIAIGMLREIVVGSNDGSTGFWSVISLGVTGSSGIALEIVGSMYLATQDLHGQAILLLALGVVCFVGGMSGEIFVQYRAPGAGG